MRTREDLAKLVKSAASLRAPRMGIWQRLAGPRRQPPSFLPARPGHSRPQPPDWPQSPQTRAPRTGRTGLRAPLEVVAKRGCFKSVERALPPPAVPAERSRRRRRRRRAPLLARSPALKSLPGSMLTCYFLYGGMASFQPRALGSSPACSGATTFGSMD